MPTNWTMKCIEHRGECKKERKFSRKRFESNLCTYYYLCLVRVYTFLSPSLYVPMQFRNSREKWWRTTTTTTNENENEIARKHILLHQRASNTIATNGTLTLLCCYVYDKNEHFAEHEEEGNWAGGKTTTTTNMTTKHRNDTHTHNV